MVDLVFLPTSVKVGAIARLIDRTVIQSGDTGVERRKRLEAYPRKAWQVEWHAGDPAAVEAVETLFEVNGREVAFLLFAPRARDHAAADQVLGLGDGVTAAFQLALTRDTGARTLVKNILYPKQGTVDVVVDGVPAVEGVDYAVSYTTGVVTFDAGSIPGSGQIVQASWDYYTPVRWDSEDLDIAILKATSDELQNEVRQATVVEVVGE